MTPVEIVIWAIRAIGGLAHNPALGGGGMRAERTNELLQMLATLLEGGGEMWEELKQFAEEIKLLVAQHGEPTRGQWEAMTARHQGAMATIAANKERLLAEQTAAQDPPVESPLRSIQGAAADTQLQNSADSGEALVDATEAVAEGEEGEEEVEEEDPAAPPDAPKKKKKKKKSSR